MVFPSCDLVSFVVLLSVGVVDFPSPLCENPPKRPLCGGKPATYPNSNSFPLAHFYPMIVYQISARLFPPPPVPGRHA